MQRKLAVRHQPAEPGEPTRERHQPGAHHPWDRIRAQNIPIVAIVIVPLSKAPKTM